MTEPGPLLAQSRFMRMVYLLAGIVLLCLGLVGMFLPLMPTTIFMILAAWCFSRSSARLERWILGHKVFGPTVTNWRRDGVISPRAKLLACSGMAVGFVLFLIGARPGLWLFLLVAAFMGSCAWYVLSRPSHPREDA